MLPAQPQAKLKPINHVLSSLIEILVLFQPLWGGLVYLSLITGHPPLWFSWAFTLFPFVLRKWRYGYFLKKTPFDIPIAILFSGLTIGLITSPDKAVSIETYQTWLVCILLYYTIVANGLLINISQSWLIKYYWQVAVLVTFLFFTATVLITIASRTSDLRIVSFNRWFLRPVKSCCLSI